MDKAGVNRLISLYLQQVHEKIWSRVTNSRMPFAVNVTPSLSYTISLVYL